MAPRRFFFARGVDAPPARLVDNDSLLEIAEHGFPVRHRDAVLEVSAAGIAAENLQDLEFEYKAGKIAREDYETLRENYIAEAAQLMVASQEEEQVISDDAMIEREVAARRARRKLQAPGDYVCPECGSENPLPVKFCGECGARIKPRARK